MTILIVIIGLSLLILGHEWGHFFAAKKFGLKIDEFGFGFPPRIFAWRPKSKLKKGDPASALATARRSETEYSFNWLPFGGFVKIVGENDRMVGDLSKLNDLTEPEKKRIFLFQPAWKRSVIILAGIFINFVIGWVLFSAVAMIGTPPALIISSIQEGSPAEMAGIKPNDVVKDYKDADLFISFVNENRGREISFLVLRGSEEVVIKATPRAKAVEGEGGLGVGLAPAGASPEGFFGSMASGFEQTVYVTKGTFAGFYMMLKGLITTGKVPADISGPVGIFSVANEIGKIGYAYLINLIALISVNLAVLNLIPFPALDGGRFVMILAEKVKGSPVPVKIEGIINGVGFALLLLLMMVITARDVVRLF